MKLPAAPRAPRRPHSTAVHGVSMDDPYHWLRDPGYPDVTDPDILEYLKTENAYHDAFFEAHAGLVDRLYEELKGRIPGSDASVPLKDGRWYYQWRFGEGDDHRTHHRRQESGAWELFFDERQEAKGHDSFRLGGMDVSDDSLLAFAIDTEGEERFGIRVRDLARGVDLPDTIENTIGEPIWIPGSSTFVYLELSDEWRPFRVRAHSVGDSVEHDRILFEEPDTGFFVDVDLSQDREYLIIATSDHETSEAHVLPARVPLADPVVVAPRRAGHEYDVDHGNGRFIIRTNGDAVNFRLVCAPDDARGESAWQDIVPHRGDVYLRDFTPFADFLVLEERHEGNDRIAIQHYNGDSHLISFPEPVFAATQSENPEYAVASVRFHYESMVTPPTVFDYEVSSRTLIERKVQEIPSGYDRARYRTERLWAPARDGERIPVSIVYRDDFPRNGSGFVHLYAYGAYGYGMSPDFSRNQLSLLDRGFAFAIAHVRGGDEMGHQWYLDGRRNQRWNTFHDFEDTARHLISVGLTSAGRIVISGGSAGGEVMGVALNETPDLWAAAIAHVPFVDVTSTMLDETLPLTPMEWPEWGNPVTDEQAFAYIRSYSPYDNVRPQDYPPLYITAGLNDPRVTYWEPAKWTARLREKKMDANLLLLKTEMGAGHAGKTGRFTRLHDAAREIAFMLVACGYVDPSAP